MRSLWRSFKHKFEIADLDTCCITALVAVLTALLAGFGGALWILFVQYTLKQIGVI